MKHCASNTRNVARRSAAYWREAWRRNVDPECASSFWRSPQLKCLVFGLALAISWLVTGHPVLKIMTDLYCFIGLAVLSVFNGVMLNRVRRAINEQQETIAKLDRMHQRHFELLRT